MQEVRLLRLVLTDISVVALRLLICKTCIDSSKEITNRWWVHIFGVSFQLLELSQRWRQQPRDEGHEDAATAWMDTTMSTWIDLKWISSVYWCLARLTWRRIDGGTDPNFICERVCTSNRLMRRMGGLAKDITPNTCVTVCGVSGTVWWCAWRGWGRWWVTALTVTWCSSGFLHRSVSAGGMYFHAPSTCVEWSMYY